MNREKASEELNKTKSILFNIQWLYEKEEGYNEQSIIIYRSMFSLLDLYQEIIEYNRVFDEDYLKKYL